MNAKAWIPLVIAIALGLVAALFARKLTSPGPVNMADLGDRVEVATANRSFSPGDEIRAEDVSLRPISAKDAPEGTFVDMTQVIGRVVTVPMVAGQPLLESCLAPIGTAAGIQALVPEGMRAISLEVNEFSGLSGMLVPGSFVDIISTIHAQGEDTMARTVVQNVEVKAVGQRINPQEKTDAEAPLHRSVTLLVTPEQAEKLELAVVTMRNAGAGLPWLVLRAPHDKDEKGTRGVTVADLRGGARRSGGHDPFETRPVESTATPTTNPVKLIEHTAPIRSAYTTQREVTIIRGGVESKVILETPRGDQVITGTELDYINK